MHTRVAPFSTPGPLDLIAQTMTEFEWPFERDEQEITVVIDKPLTDYRANWFWMEEKRILHFSLSFVYRTTEGMEDEVRKFLTLINSTLWLGHLEYWPEDGLIMFRHGTPLPKDSAYSEQCLMPLMAAIEIFDGFMPAFKSLLQGHTAETAYQNCSSEMIEGLRPN